jgi:hypothetical protein
VEIDQSKREKIGNGEKETRITIKATRVSHEKKIKGVDK